MLLLIPAALLWALILTAVCGACREAADGDKVLGLTPVPGATVQYDDDGRPIVAVATCGVCGRSWNDAAVSSVTPVPAARCPFESEHPDAREYRVPPEGLRYFVAIGGVFIDPEDGTLDGEKALALASITRAELDDDEPVTVVVCHDDDSGF